MNAPFRNTESAEPNRDDRALAGPQNAGGNQFEHEFPIADLYRVPGVMPALIARNDVKMIGEKIDNLPFPLVSPLRPKNDNVFHGPNPFIVSQCL